MKQIVVTLRKIVFELVSKDPDFPVSPVIQYWLILDDTVALTKIMIGKKQFEEMLVNYKFVPDQSFYNEEKKTTSHHYHKL